MTIKYDENNKVGIIEIISDKEGLFDAMTVLIEKKQFPRTYKNGFELNVSGILKLDLINEKLLFVF